MKQIRFIHAADLHLDSPFQGLRDLPETIFQQIRESTFVALQKLVDYAIDQQVNFVILAGDIFDGENRSLKAQVKLKRAMEQLQQYGICCYIVHGNHDHLKGNWLSISWPENVFFFKDEVNFFEFQNDNVTVHLYGYSYPQKTVKDNIVAKYEKQGVADFHIGILHGTAEGQVGHDQYAPFSVRQLVEKDFDYWALGHIHKRQVLHKAPFVVYPGNFQGRHKKELGEKGVYLVELNDVHSLSSLTFLPTSEIYWDELTIKIDELETIDELTTCCEAALSQAKKPNHSLLVVLKFTGRGVLHQYLIEQVDEFIEIFNMDQEKKANFCYIIDKKLETIGEWDRNTLKNEQHLLSDIVSIVDKLNSEEELLLGALTEVYQHHKFKHFLPPMTKEEQKQLLLEAESYLLSALLKERDE